MGLQNRVELGEPIVVSCALRALGLGNLESGKSPEKAWHELCKEGVIKEIDRSLAPGEGASGRLLPGPGRGERRRNALALLLLVSFTQRKDREQHQPPLFQALC